MMMNWTFHSRPPSNEEPADIAWPSCGTRIHPGCGWALAGLAWLLATGWAWAGSWVRPVDLRVLEDPAGGVQVEWTRAQGPPQLAGWHLERREPDGAVVRVTAERVEPGLFDSEATRYRVHDTGTKAQAGDGLTYRLVVVDPELHEWPTAFVAFQVAAQERPPAEPAATPARILTAPKAAAAKSTAGNRIRIVVTNDGLYRLTSAQIAASLQGYDAARVEQAITRTNLALTCGGQPVAWRAAGGGTSLLFFGQAYRDVYTDRNVYWLQIGRGQAMPASNRTTSTVASEGWFWDTARVEQDTVFGSYLPGGVDDDYFVWTAGSLTAPAATWQWTTAVPLTDAHPAVSAGTVTAHLVSIYDGPPELDNRTRIAANGEWIGDQRWAETGACLKRRTPTI
jgi:hypothetical protein